MSETGQQVAIGEYLDEQGQPTVKIVFPDSDGRTGVVILMPAWDALDFARNIAGFAGMAMSRLPKTTVN